MAIPRCPRFRRPSRQFLLLAAAFLLIAPLLLPFLVAAVQDLIQIGARRQSGR